MEGDININRPQQSLVPHVERLHELTAFTHDKNTHRGGVCIVVTENVGQCEDGMND